MEKIKNQQLKLKLNKQVIAVLAQTDLMAIKGGGGRINFWSVNIDCTGRPTSLIPGSIICCEGEESN